MSDYFSVLAQRIEEIQINPAESRWVIYELARSSLRKQVYLAYPPLSRDQVREQIAALEDAIARVETAAVLQDERRRIAHQAPAAEPPAASHPSVQEPMAAYTNESAIPDEPSTMLPDAGDPRRFDRFDPWDDVAPSRGELVLAPSRLVDQPASFPPVASPYYRAPGAIQTLDFTRPPEAEIPVAPRKRLLSMLGGTLQIMIASLAAVAIYAAVSGRSGEPAKPATGIDKTGTDTTATLAERASAVPGAAMPSAAPAPPPPPAYPLPAMYGVYAIASNQLVALEQVTTGPVDPRTRSTLQITKPSRITLTDSKLSFILYRRDLLTSAPEKVPIRIAAKITRTMNFDSNGRAVIVTPPNESWLIRDVGYDLRVLPVRESQEMVFVRPEDSEFSFPPGRYVLMFNGQPYDFTVEGPVTSPEHCVEGFATVRGPAFNECRPQAG